MPSWLTGQIAGVVMFVLAIIGIFCGPISAWQHFEIAGLHTGIKVFGYEIGIEGLRDKAANAAKVENDLKQARANEKTLQTQLDRQSAAYAALAKTDARNLAEAQAAVTKAQAKANLADQRLAAFRTHVPVGPDPATRLLDEWTAFTNTLGP